MFFGLKFRALIMLLYIRFGLEASINKPLRRGNDISTNMYSF